MKYVALAVFVVVVAMQVALTADPPKKESTSLRVAVREFNEKTMKNPIGKDQPALTEDEVIASIRGWDRQRFAPVTDEVYNVFQKIAETRELPKGAWLGFKTSWIRQDYHFDVWWIDLTISTGEKTGFTYRIRDRKICSVSVGSAQ